VRANPNAGWLVVAGGALVILGPILPWLTFDTVVGPVSVKGSDLAGWGFYLLGGFAVARGLSIALPNRFAFRFGTPIIGGVILAFLVASQWTRLHDLIRGSGATASIGIGFWLVVAGTACVLAGGVLAMRRN
jgi:hypothetical protein